MKKEEKKRDGGRKHGRRRKSRRGEEKVFSSLTTRDLWMPSHIVFFPGAKIRTMRSPFFARQGGSKTRSEAGRRGSREASRSGGRKEEGKEREGQERKRKEEEEGRGKRPSWKGLGFALLLPPQEITAVQCPIYLLQQISFSMNRERDARNRLRKTTPVCSAPSSYPRTIGVEGLRSSAGS